MERRKEEDDHDRTRSRGSSRDQSRSPAENLVGSLQEKLGLDHEKHAEQLLENLEKEQAAAQAARNWQEVLDRTQDPYARKYFEGLVHVSALKAVHNQLVGLAHAKASKESAYETIIPETMKGRPAPRSTNSPPRRNHRPRLSLIEKGLAKARMELDGPPGQSRRPRTPPVPLPGTGQAHCHQGLPGPGPPGECLQPWADYRYHRL